METAGDILRALLKKAGFWRRLPKFKMDYGIPLEVETLRSIMDGSIPMDESHLKLLVNCGFVIEGSETYGILLHAIEDDRKFRYEVKTRSHKSERAGGTILASAPESEQGGVDRSLNEFEPPDAPSDAETRSVGESLPSNNDHAPIPEELAELNPQEPYPLDLVDLAFFLERVERSLRMTEPTSKSVQYVDDSLPKLYEAWLDELDEPYDFHVPDDRGMTPGVQFATHTLSLFNAVVTRLQYFQKHIEALHTVLFRLRDCFPPAPPPQRMPNTPTWSRDGKYSCSVCGRTLPRYESQRFVRYSDRPGYYLEITYKCACGKEEKYEDD